MPWAFGEIPKHMGILWKQNKLGYFGVAPCNIHRNNDLYGVVPCKESMVILV